jgi:hypothetical protein
MVIGCGSLITFHSQKEYRSVLVADNEESDRRNEEGQNSAVDAPSDFPLSSNMSRRLCPPLHEVIRVVRHRDPSLARHRRASMLDTLSLRLLWPAMRSRISLA